MRKTISVHQHVGCNNYFVGCKKYFVLTEKTLIRNIVQIK